MLRGLHLLTLAVWAAAAFRVQLSLWRGGRAAETPQGLAVRRRLQPWLAAEHVGLALALASGYALTRLLGWGLGHARWFGVKLGLVAFLVVPLEGMHAYICHVWIARGLLQTREPPFSKDLLRGIGMEEMVRTLELPLLGIGVPLLVWLSVAQP